MSEQEPHVIDAAYVSRRASDAASRVASTVALIRHQADDARNEYERWLAGYEAVYLLWKVLGEVASLVDVFNDDSDLEFEAEDAERDALALHRALRARRLARKLDNVVGRTRAETEAFQAKAQELRA